MNELGRGSMRVAAVVALVGLIGAACGSSNGGGSSGSGSVSGEVAVSGSSTVLPISTRVSEKFSQQYPDVSVSVDGPGTTDGFVLFCKGETDVNDASRPIDMAAEAPVCKKNGVDFIELKIGIDGLTMMTNPANKDITCLDFKDLYALIGPESKGFTQWSDASSLGQEIGAGHAPYPDVPLDITGPGQESGTWGSFVDFIVKPIGEERGLSDEELVTRPDYQSSANDNTIIQGIEGSPTSLGWTGFAYFEQNQGAVKAIQVAGDDGSCVEPTTQTISDRSYPLSRDLFIYVNKEKLAGNPALQRFVDYYMSTDGLASVSEVGYVDQPDEVVQASQQTWANRETGTQEG